MGFSQSMNPPLLRQDVLLKKDTKRSLFPEPEVVDNKGKLVKTKNLEDLKEPNDISLEADKNKGLTQYKHEKEALYLRFDTGKSFFRGKEIKEIEKPKKLENLSFELESTKFENAGNFDPNLDISDDDKNKLILSGEGDGPDKPDSKIVVLEKGFKWRTAIQQSLLLLTIQHSFRLLQPKTTRELKGPFFSDWGKSVRNLGGWRDGDGFFTNYVAHPSQGSVNGRIFLNNSAIGSRATFGKSRAYVESRLRAMVWSAIWSVQFELGPISEANIGNVGLYDDVGPNRMGWVDLVVTPTVGTGFLVGEDMVDKYVLNDWLEKSSSRRKVIILRTLLTPLISFSNVLNGKPPWFRYNRH